MEHMDDEQSIELDDWDDSDIPTIQLPRRDGGWTYEAIQEFREERRRLNGGIPRTERLVVPADDQTESD